MFNSILVPVDISESRLTEQVIPYVQANAAIGNGKIHFLTVVPSFPYYSSLGLAYSVEMPKLAEIQEEALTKLKEMVKQFNLPADRVETHAISGDLKIRS